MCEEQTQEGFELRINCFRQFDHSFNRAKYFPALAECLGATDLPTDWNFSGRDGLTIKVDPPAKEEEKRHILEGYQHFLNCYLVRDCIESFAISLDSLCHVSLLPGKRIQSGQTLLSCLSEEERDFLKKFKNAGLTSKEGKVQLLRERFGIQLSPDSLKTITSLKDIRNCFAHGNGFVRKEDGQPDGKKKRRFRWTTLHLFVEGDSGCRHTVPLLGQPPLPEDGTLCGQFVEHQKSFDIGAQLSFSRLELFEIAFSLQRIGKELIKLTAEKITPQKQSVCMAPRIVANLSSTLDSPLPSV